LGVGFGVVPSAHKTFLAVAPFWRITDVDAAVTWSRV